MLHSFALAMAGPILLAAAVASPPPKPQEPGDDYVMRLAFESPAHHTPDPDRSPLHAELPPHTDLCTSLPATAAVTDCGHGDWRGGGDGGDDDGDDGEHDRTVRRGYGIEFRRRGFAHLTLQGAGAPATAASRARARPVRRSRASGSGPPRATQTGGATPQSRRLRRGAAGWTPTSNETADVTW